MMPNSPLAVMIPLINPNEPEALLANLDVVAGQSVAANDRLCTLETTKASADVLAETGGYVIGLCCEAGQTVRAGDLLCYLSPDPEWTPPQVAGPRPAAQNQRPPGLRISRPALALARRHGLDLAQLPTGPLITEREVQNLLAQAAGPDFLPAGADFDPTAVIIYGGGGHGKALIDLLRALGTYRIAGILDDRLTIGEQVLGVSVLGGGEALARLHSNGIRLAVNAVGGIGDVTVRVSVFKRLAEAGFACPAVIHPAAFVEPSARLSPGSQVFPHAYLGSAAQAGFGAIINTGAIVSHDCMLGDYANISPGAMLAGGVQVGSGVLVGMGVTVNLDVRIGAGARLGNGATIKADVPERGVVRAGTIWPE